MTVVFVQINSELQYLVSHTTDYSETSL